MDGYHPKNKDPRPKRRKDRDNPYTIFTTGIQTNSPHYWLSFTDNQGERYSLEICRELFDALDQFELDDLSVMNEIVKTEFYKLRKCFGINIRYFRKFYAFRLFKR